MFTALAFNQTPERSANGWKMVKCNVVKVSGDHIPCFWDIFCCIQFITKVALNLFKTCLQKS